MAVNRQETEDYTPESTKNETVHRKAITWRSIIFGLLGIFAGVWWGVYGDVVSQTDLTSTSLMIPPVIILAAFVAVNALVRKVLPGSELARGELITIYAMTTVGVVLSGMGMLQFLITTLGAVPYYGPQFGWEGYLDNIPAHTIMPKLSAIQGFYEGGEPVPYSAWIRPMVFWSLFLFSMLFTMTCINSILRKQWVERERLTYPIVALPLEMTDPSAGFFKNKMMWLGFLVAAGLETMNSLNYLYPTLPFLQIRAAEIIPPAQTVPWSAFGGITTTFYPLAIGLGYLLATEISFSCWFFYFFAKFQNLFVAAIGWKGGVGSISSPPYLGQQGTGGFIGIVIVVVYLARNHLKDVFRKAVKGAKDVDDSNEPLGYRTSVFGALIGFFAMIGFCIYVGISPLIAFLYIGIFILFSITIARLRAEAGPAWIEGPGMNAFDSVTNVVGSGNMTRNTLIAMGFFNWFATELRCNPMPQGAEAFKMGQVANVRQRWLGIIVLVAIVVGIAVGFMACLHVWYTYGAGTAKVEPWRTGMGADGFHKATRHLNNPTVSDIPTLLAVVFGAGVTFLLSYLRTQLIWFPFHPVGYVLANTSTLHWLWTPLFIAWLCKVVITKYGGIKAYRFMMPFFLGLIFGDYMTSGLWALAGSILGIQMYRCFPC